MGAVPGGIDPIYKQYHVVIFSHYPVFCSKTDDDLESCTKNKNIFKEYLEIFNEIGMDLYMSGHLHYYERTHIICQDFAANNFSYLKPELV